MCEKGKGGPRLLLSCSALAGLVAFASVGLAGVPGQDPGGEEGKESVELVVDVSLTPQIDREDRQTSYSTHRTIQYYCCILHPPHFPLVCAVCVSSLCAVCALLLSLLSFPFCFLLCKGKRIPSKRKEKKGRQEMEDQVRVPLPLPLLRPLSLLLLLF